MTDYNSTTTLKRYQKVKVIRRISDGKFYMAPRGSTTPSWTDDIRLANFVTPRKVKSLIRAVWGRDEEDYEAIDVVPTLACWANEKDQ